MKPTPAEVDKLATPSRAIYMKEWNSIKAWQNVARHVYKLRGGRK